MQENGSGPGHGSAGRLEKVKGILETRLEDEGFVLDVLMSELARGQGHPELWTRLHEAAVRDDLMPELAFAYEQLARGKKLRALPPPVQTEILMHAATFFVDVFGDAEAAVDILERVLAVTPGHVEAFARLERLLIASQNWLSLADLYARAAAHRQDKKEKIAILRRAAELVDRIPGEEPRAIRLYEEILAVDPAQPRFRRILEQRYLLAGRYREAAAFLEQVLASQPAPEEDEAFAMRTRLMVLYAGELQEPERALPHADELLRRDAAHQQARTVAERLLGHAVVGARAALSLADAFERLGSPQEATALLKEQIERVPPAHRPPLQRRLALLEADTVRDLPSALPLLEAAVLADPADEAVRRRFRQASIALDRKRDVPRVLTRALAATKEQALRARLGAELGDALIEAGDAKRARAAYREVLDAGGDEAAMLAAARALVNLYTIARDHRALGFVLRYLAKNEQEPKARWAVAERLGRLCQNELADPEAAIAAWGILIGTPAQDRALAALEKLYEATGAYDDLAELLEQRAKNAQSAAAARALAFRAADVRLSRTVDKSKAIDGWKAFVRTHGASCDAHGRLIALLEEEGRWEEVVGVLQQELKVAPVAERPSVLARMAQVRLQRLGDPHGALELCRESLQLDASDRLGRQILEELLASQEHSITVVDLLEPLYRNEGATTDVVRLIELRAEATSDPEKRFAYLDEAVTLLERDVKDAPRALELSARALRDAIESSADRIEAWLERFERIVAEAARISRVTLTSDGGAPGRGEGVGETVDRVRATLLTDALGDHPVNSAALLKVAIRTAEALAESADGGRALAVYRRALAFDPESAELKERVEKLTAEQRGPEERLGALRTQLADAAERAKRRELLHAIAKIEQHELANVSGAVDAYRRALEEDADDVVALEALTAAHAASGDKDAARAAQIQLAAARRRLGDLVGARSLLEGLVVAEPNQIELRREYCELSATLDRRADAARALGRVAGRVQDAAVRASIGTDVGRLWYEAGEMHRARAAYREALDAHGDAESAVVAARALVELYLSNGEPRLAAEMLELLARIEPEPDARWGAAERLGELLRRDLHDAAAAVTAYRMLLDSPRREGALDALTTLYEEMGAYEELSALLDERARDVSDANASRVFALRATDVRVARMSDPNEVVGAWRTFVVGYGPSRDVFARTMPLLEELGRWDELAAVLLEDAAIAPPDERAPILARAAEIRLTRLHDVSGSLALYRQALAFDPDDRTTHLALERMLRTEHALAAGELLAPTYRARGAASDLLRVLEAQIEAAPEAASKLAMLDEAVAVLERDIGDARRALDLAGRALRVAVQNAPDQVGAWLDRVERLAPIGGDPARHAGILSDALGDRAIDGRAMARLARCAGEALEAYGDTVRALALYRKALAFEPESPGLKARVYRLVMARAAEGTHDARYATVEAYQRVLALDPEVDALFAVAMLLPSGGAGDDALMLIENLRDRSAGSLRTSFELLIAEVLLDRLERVEDAFAAIERVVRDAPGESAAIPLLERALARPALRARVAELLERVSAAADDPQRALALLQPVLSSAPEELEPSTTRRERFARLLEANEHRPDVALLVAVHAATESPDDTALWDRAERLARALGRPRPVADAYLRLLDAKLEPELAQCIGRRAVEFHEEWFEDQDATIALLRRLLSIETDRWAFDRLKVAFSSAGRWSDLFALYERAIRDAQDDPTRARLLDEAAQIAKDFANDTQRSIQYLERLAQLRPGDARVSGALERLYDKSGDTRKLIELHTARLAALDGEEAQELRARVAALWVDAGDDPAAFELIEQMLAIDGARPEAFALLERMLLSSDAADARQSRPGVSSVDAGWETPPERRTLPVPMLRRAAFLLERRYSSLGRTPELVRVLQIALDTARDDAERCDAHGRLARLHVDLGNPSAAFEHVAELALLEPDAGHEKTLFELAAPLEGHRRLADVLVAAASRATNPLVRARLTASAAAVWRDRLDDRKQAIDLFARAMELADGDAALVLAHARHLEPLLSSEGRDAERCTVLERIAQLEGDGVARSEAYGEVARIAADVLHDADRAIRAWCARLDVDANDATALDGLARVLEHAQRWQELIDVLERRAAISDPDAARADRVYIARIYLDELAAVSSAITAWARVRELFGPDAENFAALSKLLRDEERWQELAVLFESEGAIAKSKERRVELLVALGDLRRDRLRDSAAAAVSYADALALDPRARAAQDGLLSLWSDVNARPTIIEVLSTAYVDTNDWARAAELADLLATVTRPSQPPSSEEATTQRPRDDVPPPIGRAFWWGVAVHHRDARADGDGAERAFRRALAHDQGSIEILSALADLQRLRPSRGLVDTLVRLSVAKGGDLDLLREAAEVAMSKLADVALATGICERLLAVATDRWTAVGEAEPTLQSNRRGVKREVTARAASAAAERMARWSLGELVRMGLERGDAPRVVEMLKVGARLPFGRTERRTMRADAATISLERLHDFDGATAMFAALFEEDASDDVAVQALPTFAELLDARGRDADVVELWEGQARWRAKAGQEQVAAELWTRAAEIAAARLGDEERAIADYERAASLGGLAALEALAAIRTRRGEHRIAAEVLERICSIAPRDTLAARVLRLADAYVAAGEVATARERLEQAARAIPDAHAVRARLAALYRAEGAWDPLAALLTAEVDVAAKPSERFAFLREAAELHLVRRADPAAAIPLLERAFDVAPDEPSVALSLAEALGAVNRHADAARVLDEQIKRFGARKPKDRAQVHFALSRACKACGDNARALDELDKAARIDPAHPGILVALGREALQANDLDRAQRAFQALLLLSAHDNGAAQRPVDGRRTSIPPPDATVSRSLVLIELVDIAMKRGEPDRAAEFRESAFEAARESEEENARFEHALRARGQQPMYIRSLEARVSSADGPAKAAKALAELAGFAARVGGDPDLDARLRSHATKIRGDLEAVGYAEPEAWRALERVYQALGDDAAKAALGGRGATKRA